MRTSGTSEPTNTAGLSHGSGPLEKNRGTLEVLSQIHARVETGHLIAVTVEGKRLAAAKLADPALGGLAPARVIHVRIDVGVETVLVRRGEVPAGVRLLLHEPDLDDRLDSLEAVLPGDHQAQRRAILIG